MIIWCLFWPQVPRAKATQRPLKEVRSLFESFASGHVVYAALHNLFRGRQLCNKSFPKVNNNCAELWRPDIGFQDFSHLARFGLIFRQDRAILLSIIKNPSGTKRGPWPNHNISQMWTSMCNLCKGPHDLWNQTRLLFLFQALVASHRVLTTGNLQMC